SGPKLRPKGVGDGQQVDIPVPPRNCLSDGATQEDKESHRWMCVQAVRELDRQIRLTISSCDGEGNIVAKFLIPHCQEKPLRSEEHTSELQSRFDAVCRLLHDTKKAQ